MPRRSDPRKLTVWRERLQRFSNSGLSADRFCAEEGVSCSSFYKWRKKLEQESPLGGSGAESRQAGFREVTVIPSAPGVSIHLPCGTRIEVGSEHLETVRAVIGEVARAGVQLGNAAPC